MAARPDLVAEHGNLVLEKVKLQKLCVDEWPIMSHQVAVQRQNRLLAIRERLLAIERSATWRGRRG